MPSPGPPAAGVRAAAARSPAAAVGLPRAATAAPGRRRRAPAPAGARPSGRRQHLLVGKSAASLSASARSIDRFRRGRAQPGPDKPTSPPPAGRWGEGCRPPRRPPSGQPAPRPPRATHAARAADTHLSGHRLLPQPDYSRQKGLGKEEQGHHREEGVPDASG